MTTTTTTTDSNPIKRNHVLFALLLISVVVITYLLLFLVGVHKPEWKAGVFRLFLIVVLTAVPCSLYFVFIALRKPSLLQEYLSNLNRLGLLQSNYRDLAGFAYPYDDGASDNYLHRVRVLSYLKRFESVYGPIDDKVTDEILDQVVKPSKQRTSSSDSLYIDRSSGVGPIFSISTAIPVVLATVLIALCWWLVLPPIASDSFNVQSVLKFAALESAQNDRFSGATTFAFFGAYFFCVQMLFRRFVTNDLRPKVYAGVSMRMILALLGAWLIVASFGALAVEAATLVPNADADTPGPATDAANPGEPGNGVLIVLAFVVGAFPPVLWRVTRSVLRWLPGKFVPNMNSSLPISELDGLTVWHQARLEEEDVENTFNVADVDIVDLLLGTRIPPHRIIDWVDQAIFLSALNEPSKKPILVENASTAAQKSKREVLHDAGIRMASSVVRWVDNPDRITSSTSNSPTLTESALAAHNGILSYENLQLILNWKGIESSDNRIAVISTDVPMDQEISKHGQ